MPESLHDPLLPDTEDIMIAENGIWPLYEALYIEAMLFNARSAAASIESVSYTLKAISDDQSGELFKRLDQRAFLNELQNIVLQAAALSLYFWPMTRDNDRYISRARRLRHAFDMKDDSPLRNRNLRNQIEHFDEKLDDYLTNDMTGYILPEYVGALPKSDGVPAHLFRAYYIDAGLFEALGKRYEMQPLVDAIACLHNYLLACHNGRLPDFSSVT